MKITDHRHPNPWWDRCVIVIRNLFSGVTAATPRCPVHGTEMFLMTGLHRESGGFVDNYWACLENRCGKTSHARNREEAERQSQLQLMSAEEVRAAFPPIKKVIPVLVDPGIGETTPESIELHVSSWNKALKVKDA
jgi:hypothetical protein